MIGIVDRGGKESVSQVFDCDWLRILQSNLSGISGHFLVMIGDERQLFPFGGHFVSAINIVRFLLNGSVAQWWRYSLTRGLTDLGGSLIAWEKFLPYSYSGAMARNSSDNIAQLLGLLTAALQWPAGYQGRMVLILDNLELMVPARTNDIFYHHEAALLEYALYWAGKDEAIAKSGNFILAWARNRSALHPWLREKESKIIFQELPSLNVSTKTTFILQKAEQMCFADDAKTWHQISAHADELSRLSMGMNLHELNNLLTSVSPASGLHQLKRELEIKRKDGLLAEASDVLSLIESPLALDDLGGLSKVKPYLNSVLDRFCGTWSNGDLSDTDDRDTGSNGTNIHGVGSFGNLLFMGPPGTGKTAVATALAKKAGLLCVSPLNVQEKWIGASERNLERLLQACLKFAPLILFLDELDLTFGRRVNDGDSGTSNRLFQRMLTLLGNHEAASKILIIGATNWPNKLDQALIRSGRFYAKVPFFLPTVAEKVDIIQRIIHGLGLDNGTERTELLGLVLTEKLELASGADLAALVAEAGMIVRRAKREKILIADLRQAALELIITNDKIEIMLMSLIAAKYAARRSFLPPSYQRLIDNGQIDNEISQLASIGKGGVLWEKY